jgi:hypothetical protein
MNAGSNSAQYAEGAVSQFRILHCLRAPVGGLFRHVCDLTAELHAGVMPSALSAMRDRAMS